MNRYIATFHTHLSAMRTQRALVGAGISALLAPVPRYLSASCGTCVRYEAKEDMRGCLDRDFDQLVQLSENNGFQVLLKND